MKQSLFRFLADLRFAIFILLLIALFSIIGTVIEQGQSIEIYKQNYPLVNPILGFLSWDIILKFGLDHIYKTWWFIFLIIIFGTSLLTCTVLQQFPSLKNARRCQFFRVKKQFRRLKTYYELNNPQINQLLFRMQTKQYSIFQQKNIIYCYKGLIGRITPIIVHFSMIIILIGSIYGSLTGFNAQEIVPKTEIFHIQNILNDGQLTNVPNLATRVNDFWITYTDKTTINQFYSDISILSNYGSEIKRQTILVNSPETYNNIFYYQTDWNLVGLRLDTGQANSPMQYPLITPFNNNEKLWLSWIPISNTFDDGITILFNNLQGLGLLYDKLGSYLGNWELNEKIQQNSLVKLIDIISSTGLQVKTDPGIPLVYTGFALLMVSTIISYITYSQIWIVKKKNFCCIGGNTSRAKFDFELEFFELIQK